MVSNVLAWKPQPTAVVVAGVLPPGSRRPGHDLRHHCILDRCACLAECRTAHAAAAGGGIYHHIAAAGAFLRQADTPERRRLVGPSGTAAPWPRTQPGRRRTHPFEVAASLATTPAILARHDPARLFAVAHVGFPLARESLWRTDDGGKTWTRSPLLGGSANTPAGFAADPVVAAGGHGLVLYGGSAFDINTAAGTVTQQIGTRVSTDGGASFTGLAARTRRFSRFASSSRPALGRLLPASAGSPSTSRGWPSTPPVGPSPGRRTWSGCGG
jgi:hypothetical protein